MKTFKNLQPGRFIAAWIIGSIAMFGLSYLWHGVILNDFNKLGINQEYFMVLFTMVYLVIGAVLTFLFTYMEFTGKKLMKRILLGGALGFFIYLIAFVLGVSFNSTQLEHVVVDFAWQMAEQAGGAAVVSFVFSVSALRARVKEMSQAVD